MNRRGFLAALAGLGAAAVAGELLAPKRSIFLPPRGGWFLTADFARDGDVLALGVALLKPEGGLAFYDSNHRPPDEALFAHLERIRLMADNVSDVPWPYLQPGPVRFFLPQDAPGISLYNTSHPWKT